MVAVAASARSVRREEIMRYFALSLLFAALSIAMQTRTLSAAQIQDKYCLQGRQWGYPGNCHFSTYGQCQATASGTGASCGINPRHAFARQRHGGHRHYNYQPY
jgi:hypothetical protein